ncbi:tyrosine-type recombinase/integrase [Paraburkholderia acidisoli]|uniref:Tyrosine-type recombinase/integrase n=1 Tax=Paraburkholderia acidisoli TaxID=2571748 RepID=A0A7Z2GIL1_9BURK|nr:integrase arm-type DNA-binding domain-containing protein [Paraburkholderia acidisoli]QGZ62475.1 tyrosine-type recombinase/integrase [Paraburkholderia acidisoli]
MPLLTDAAVRGLKAREKPYKVSDSGGMYLYVLPTGAKYWRLAYRLAGRQKTFAIGVYPEVTLAEARESRDSAKKLVKAGIDPVSHRADVDQRRLAAQQNTFEVVARQWHNTRKLKWSDNHGAKILSSMERDLFPAFGTKAVGAISRSDILAAIRKVEARGAHEIAHRVLQRCVAVFDFACAGGLVEVNPAARLSGQLTTVPVTHYKAFKESELPEFLGRLSSYDGEEQTGLAIRLLMLTFVRTGELRGATWAEIDFAAGEWRIPAERMKMREGHIVPLSTQAVSVLRRLHALTGGEGLVFPGRTKATSPISENTILFALYRMGYHGRVTGHGFRTTASTILNERGFNADHIERQLAHRPKDKVRDSYNRAQYLPERRRMMQAWADLLDGLEHKARTSAGSAARAAAL